MSIFSYTRSIYALDTIDTRFTSSSNTPYKTVVDARSDSATSGSKRDDSKPGVGVKTDRHGRPVAQPSKWNTPEFYVYYFVFLTIVPYMFWIAYDVSRRSCPANSIKDRELTLNQHRIRITRNTNLFCLKGGYWAVKLQDLSDAQYYNFRKNIPYLSLLLIFHPILRKLYNTIRPLPARIGSPKPNGSTYISAAEGEAHLEQRASFDFGWALIFLAALHGFSAIKVLLILYANFSLATRLPRKFVPVATWVFNIAILFANELSDGYKFAKMAVYLWPVESGVLDPGNALHGWGIWFDSYGGIISRWEILFNITVLRMISYNLDYYWSLDERGGNILEKKQLDPANLSERDRVSIPAASKDFNFRNYIGYTVYGPLYLTGPILTFNDYISQLKYPPLQSKHPAQ
ncbi:putative membrane-bound O-acyltransferase [Lachnellula suecica]|uniref:Putative membrane-bound O-acyltransferase n=1 Tax=Lachnellula suecica TaxID=602035 RepID=A0A8T9C1B7_9HELO|nr:putative membrane-bound O-acyltransferase [Lachnellula suecica]